MSVAWPIVALGDVLRRSEHIIPLDPETTYKEVTVRINGKGVVERRQVQGVEIAADRRYRVKSGQFIISRIDARHGASGLIPKELDGAVVTNDFPLFDVASDRLDAAFLGWMSKTASFVELCKRASEGTTNRVRLSEDRFKALNIPLPLLDEQRHIVARIEELAAKVDEAKTLNGTSLEAGRHLLSAMAHRADLEIDEKLRQGWQHTTLRDVLTEYSDPYAVRADVKYPNFGIFGFGRGLFEKTPINGLETSANRLFRARAGLFIYSRLFAFEGAYGIVDKKYDGHFVSNEYPMFVCDENRVLPEFLTAYLLPSTVWRQVAYGSGGLGDRRQRVQPEHLLKHKILLPPLDWQRRIKVVRDRLAEASSLQAQTATELSSMIPAILDKAFKGGLHGHPQG